MVEVVNLTPGSKVRCRVNDEKTEYTTLVELETSSAVTPQHFKYLFKNFAKEATSLNEECIISQFVNLEEGQYETLAQVFKFPLVSERIVVNT